MVNEVTAVARVTGPEAKVSASVPPDILAPLDSEIVPAELRVTEVLPERSWLRAMSPLVVVESEIVGTETEAEFVIEPPVALTVSDESDWVPREMKPELLMVRA